MTLKSQQNVRATSQTKQYESKGPDEYISIVPYVRKDFRLQLEQQAKRFVSDHVVHHRKKR